ncbi:hypothetical protein GPECTOR_516g494 [Gonium pectorale]|uniref:Uncharacterized protein n=1 Tax=Gonium pectorale TaxID=33097 RepID=A0A150FUU1_GONPE|nr:hypothetical protein GPECTOR_516g494 [Gonium pectorale]|eukprot:KXZ41372.1 hypothetical protein GPECTOR_516g494 [Gonium pectorale]
MAASDGEGHETSLADALQALCARGRDVLLGGLQAPATADPGRAGGDGDQSLNEATLAAARLACQALRDCIDGSTTSVTLRLGRDAETLLDRGPPPLHRWPLCSHLTLAAASPHGKGLTSATAAQLLPRLFSQVPLEHRRRITALEVDQLPLQHRAAGAEAMGRAIRALPALRRVRLWPALPSDPWAQRPVTEALAALPGLEDLTLCATPGPDLLRLMRADTLRRLNLRPASAESVAVAAASLRCMGRLQELTLREPRGLEPVAIAVAALPPSLAVLRVAGPARLLGYDDEPEPERRPSASNSVVTFELQGGAAVGLEAQRLDLGALAELRQRCGAFLRPLRRVRVTGQLALGADWNCRRRSYPPMGDVDEDGGDAAGSADREGSGGSSPEARVLGALLRQRDLALEARELFVVSAAVAPGLVKELLSRAAGVERLSLAMQVTRRSVFGEPPRVEHKLSVVIGGESKAEATRCHAQPLEGDAGGGPGGSGGATQAGFAAAPSAADLSLYDLAAKQLRTEAAAAAGGSGPAAPTLDPPPPLSGLAAGRPHSADLVRCMNTVAQRVMDGWGPAADWTGRQRLGWLLGQWAALRIEPLYGDPFGYDDEDDDDEDDEYEYYDSDWDQDAYETSSSYASYDQLQPGDPYAPYGSPGWVGRYHMYQE